MSKGFIYFSLIFLWYRLPILGPPDKHFVFHGSQQTCLCGVIAQWMHNSTTMVQGPYHFGLQKIRVEQNDFQFTKVKRSLAHSNRSESLGQTTKLSGWELQNCQLELYTKTNLAREAMSILFLNLIYINIGSVLCCKNNSTGITFIIIINTIMCYEQPKGG